MLARLVAKLVYSVGAIHDSPVWSRDWFGCRCGEGVSFVGAIHESPVWLRNWFGCRCGEGYDDSLPPGGRWHGESRDGRSLRILYPTTRFMFTRSPPPDFVGSPLPEGAFHACRSFRARRAVHAKSPPKAGFCGRFYKLYRFNGSRSCRPWYR